MDLRKAATTTIVSLVGITGTAIGGDEVLYQVQLASIPSEERLKAEKEDILQAVVLEIATSTAKYFATSTGRIIQQVVPAKQFVYYDHITDQEITDEVFNFREGETFSKERVLPDSLPNATVVELSHKPRAYKTPEGRVVKVEHDVKTTKRSFEIETRTTLLDRVVAIATPQSAYADQDEYITGSGTWTAPAGVTSVDVLIVGGGGSSPASNQPGFRPAGGGAGGVVFLDDYTVTPSSGYSYSVGAGGAYGNGATSTFDGKDAQGGGAAGNANANGNNGGSGGGGTGYTSAGTGGIGNQPTHPDGGFGNDGGNGFNSGTPSLRAGGGGGGAGAVAANTTSGTATAGGAGKYYGDIFGDSVGESGYFAGGGGGRSNSVEGAGGIGGGGDGSNSTCPGQQNGIDGTGGGGGAQETVSGCGHGGDGAIIIKYEAGGGGGGFTGQPVIWFE